MIQDGFDLRDYPETSELLDALAQAVRVGLRTHVPARVVTYDAATQEATVQVEHRTVVRLRSAEDLPPGAELVGVPPNAKAVLPPKVVTGVPVIFPGTSSAYLTVPITPGVTGTLHVHDRDLERWVTLGTATDPVMAWTHILESSEFHPALTPKAQRISPPTDLSATVVEGPLVKIGRGATTPIAKATPLITALDAFADASPVAQDGGAAIHTAFKTAWQTAKADVPATKGQVE